MDAIKHYLGIMDKINLSDEQRYKLFPKYRQRIEDFFKEALPPSGIKIEPIKINGLNAYWIIPANPISDRVFYYIHGGGWIFGSFEMYKRPIGFISKLLSVKTLFIDYRLAPEFPYPTAEEDCLEGYKFLLQSYKGSSIAIGGDSAGGNLTLQILIKLRDKNLPLPCCAVCISPVTNLTVTSHHKGTFLSNTSTDYITLPGFLFVARAYARTEEEKNKASPCLANLRDLPPLLIQSGGAEVLLDDNFEFVKKAKEDRVEVIHQIGPQQPHAFQLFGTLIPESKEYLEKIAYFIKLHYPSSKL